MNPLEVANLSEADALRAYCWLDDHEPQAARAMARFMSPHVTRLGSGDMQVLGTAMFRCPGPVELRRLYPEVAHLRGADPDPLSGGNVPPTVVDQEGKGPDGPASGGTT